MRYLTRGLCAAAFLAAACQTDINSTNQEILGGDPIAAGDFPTVVALVDNLGGICTGTLIAPRVVLTAGHCVDPVLFGGGFDEEDVARAMNIAFDSTDAFNTVFGNGSGLVVGATKTVKNPAFNINQLGDDDIGLIFLDTPVTDRTPSPVDQDNTRNLVGTQVTQVGYGVFNTANPNNDFGVGFVLEDKLVSTCATPDIQGSDRELVCYNQEDGTGKCNGDSGGPSFDAQGKIVGVTSFGDQNCVFFGADTRTSAPTELKFLQDTIDANAAIACNKDGFIFDLCAFDEDEEPLKGCGKNAVSDETTSTPLALLGLSFFVGLFTLRRRSSKKG